MQYAVVSDIHANLQAWNAVLIDSRSLGVDRIICLGDIVGYGPNPAEVLESVHASVDHLVLGNHDAVIASKITPTLFNSTARSIIDWTRARMNRDAVQFLATLPLSLKGDGFRCVHGDFSDPASFNYIIDAVDAVPSWDTVEEQLLFVGHTHEPGIHLLGPSGIPRAVEPADFELEPGKRFLVNVGSVGQPRDGLPLASYCIYDPGSGSVWWRRIPFDLDAYREALAAAGVPESGSRFLAHDPRSRLVPLRAQRDFTPASSPEETAHDVTKVQELTVLRHGLTRWKRAALSLAAACLLGLGLTALTWSRLRSYEQRIAYPVMVPVDAAAAAPDRNLLPAFRGPVRAGDPVPGWIVRLGDRRVQSVCVAEQDGESVIVMSSRGTSKGMELTSVDIHAAAGTKLCMEMMVRKGSDFAGAVSGVISLRRETGDGPEAVDSFIVKQPNMPRTDGWLLAKNTFVLPAGSQRLTFRVRGAFRGTAEVKNLSLVVKGKNTD